MPNAEKAIEADQRRSLFAENGAKKLKPTVEYFSTSVEGLRFPSAFRKLAWCAELYNSIKPAADSYRESVSILWKTRGPDDEGLFTHWREPTEDLPLTLEGLVGDAIHNIRVALDLLVSDLAELKAVPRELVSFPFDGTLQGLIKQLYDKKSARKNLWKLGEEFRDLILALKPYAGGDDRLYAINRLDNISKHRSIVGLVLHAEIELGAIGAKVFYGGGPLLYLPGARVLQPIGNEVRTISPSPPIDNLPLWKETGSIVIGLKGYAPVERVNALIMIADMIVLADRIRMMFEDKFANV